ncbi:TonB-dependent receptor [Pedobacter cryotolerans]|uniref:TonB-dependent receptor n=1 Tax=Pedobacter cryotolerans TaxID=2571270 RepID=A0A4U1BYN7_9SPHI|nr:TonB-dependent receptor [Pedobacter cryotolerans]
MTAFLKNNLKKPLFALLFLINSAAFAQTDSVKRLNEINVKGYYNPQPILRALGAVSLLDSNQIINQPRNSLVSLVNTAPGVRMEERSPGSYRLSLRGSLLRSPFGIRNVKIYIDDFPLTDAGGNTYLNAIDMAGISSLEIYKGPEASIFGANTGGAVLINSLLKNKNEVSLSTTAGSYGLFHQIASVNQNFQNYSFNFTGGYQRSDGYRANSALKRRYIQTSQAWDYSVKGKLKAFIFYSDLDYQTPGGLTAAQFAANPQAARPATPTLPSAIGQKAAIYNKTFFAGLSNNYVLNEHFNHVVALFYSNTDFKNPFITNYEKREENTFGLRSFIEFTALQNNIKYNIQGGLESSSTTTNVNNFTNAQGIAANLIASDDLKANQTFGFLKLNIDVNKKLLVELASSLNFFNYNYQSYFPVAVVEKNRNFSARLMPKLAASYLFNESVSFRASISKGYSPPTLAEVRSSDNIINNDLRAEAGWNYEAGLRYQTKNKRLNIDGNVFYFNLQDAIVRRLNENDTEFFINAGGTKQLGTELQSSYWLIKTTQNRFLNGLLMRNSFTYSRFKFDQFQNAGNDFSGNDLTGVPKHTVVSSLELNFSKRLFLFAQHNYTSSIPLNDANTAFAQKYHLVDIKTGIRDLSIGKTALAVSFGINNLLNQTYSLGNDLNAAANRYFNPAMKRNFYANIGLTL